MSFMIWQLGLLSTVWLGFAPLACAGLILVSGDVNIANFVNGSYDFPINPGNASFLKNVLGSGTRVFARAEGDDPLISALYEANVVSDLYTTIPGVTSILDSSGNAITNDSLEEVDLFLDFVPRNSYSTSELSAINDFLARSGKVFFLGDNNALSEPNTFINQALSALGSSLKLGEDTIFDGQRPWSISSNISADPFTSGIDSFGYAYTNTVSGGNPLIQTLDSRTFIAYETIGANVPEPTTLSLCSMASIVVCFGASTRRHRRERFGIAFREV